MEEGLRRHPLYRKSAVPHFPVIVVTVDIPGQTKVGDFHDEPLGDQDVPGGEVAVDALLAAQVLHALGDLAGEADELLLREGGDLDFEIKLIMDRKKAF